MVICCLKSSESCTNLIKFLFEIWGHMSYVTARIAFNLKTSSKIMYIFVVDPKKLNIQREQ